MKVIKEGTEYERKPGTYMMKCGSCAATLAFTVNDVKARFTPYDLERFITCPRCGVRIAFPSGETPMDDEDW